MGMFEITGIGPLFRVFCQGNGPFERFGMVPCADLVVCLKKGVDLSGGMADGRRVGLRVGIWDGVCVVDLGGLCRCCGCVGDVKEGGEEGEEGYEEKRNHFRGIGYLSCLLKKERYFQ